MDIRELKFLNALNSIPGVGVATLRALKNHFESFEVAWRASETALAEAALHPQARGAIIWKRSSLHPDREMEKLVREQIWIITEDNPHYPLPLKEIPQPPIILYGKGDINLCETTSGTESSQMPLVAVVGTRRPTAYGIEATEAIVRNLVDAGCTITSGLAMGVDARAHETALDTNGKTIAVLGSGLLPEVIFPPENRGLARRIVEARGAVISEYAPDTPALKEHFPQRNRIISGLSQGVVVIEAREKSGALITARFALEQNRDVFALPGSVFSPTSKGPNRLIQEGAKLITSAEDILEELGINYTKERAARIDALLGEKEQLLLGLLEEPLSVDIIKEKTGFETSLIIASLSLLELHGQVRKLGGDTFQKV